MGEMFGKWPHEVALGRSDLPGSEIPLAHLKFDRDCAVALMEMRAKAQEKASKG